jgi:signal transduction histidine kinase
MRKILVWALIIVLFSVFIGVGTKEEIEWTQAELDWMAEHPVIRIALDYNFGPIEYLNDEGELEGATVDYITWIEAHTPLEFQYEEIGEWSKIVQASKKKEIDMLVATMTEYREEYLLFTEPFISVPNIIITRIDGPSNIVLDDLYYNDLVVLKDYAIVDYLSFNYPDINLKTATSLDEGISLIVFGTEDYMVVSLAQASFYMKEKAVTNLKVAGNTGYNNDLSFGIRDDWPMLRKIMNKALSTMSAQEHKRIYSKWITIDVDQFIRQEVVYAIMILIAIILAALISILFFNHVLRLRVDERTALYKQELHDRKKAEEDLAALNDTLEDKVRERTEELSAAIHDLKQVQQKLIETEKMASLGRVIMGVSHQLNTPIGTSISLVSLLKKKQEEVENRIINGQLSKQEFLTYLETTSEAVNMVEKELFRSKDFIEHFKEMSANTYPQEKKRVHMPTYLYNVLGIFANRLNNKRVEVTIECDDNLEIYTSLVYLNNIFKNLISNSLKHGFRDTKSGNIFISVEKENDHVEIRYKDDGIGIERDILTSVYEPLFTTSMGKYTGLGLNILYNTVVTSMNGSLDLSSELGLGVNFLIKFKA